MISSGTQTRRRIPIWRPGCNSIVLETVEQHTLHVKKRMRLKYSPRKIAGFVCFGMFGFVNESREENTPMDELLPQARVLLTDLIRSGILTEDEH